MSGSSKPGKWVVVTPASTAAGNAENPWERCPECKGVFDVKQVETNLRVCPSCGKHHRITSWVRIAQLVDSGTFVEWDPCLIGGNPLDFPGYDEKLSGLREKTGLSEAVRCGAGDIGGIRTAVVVMDSTFMMGSMGAAVGEKITRAVERATVEGLPIVIFTASGGARMQEGIVSLMQMAKISCAIERHGELGLFYLAVLTDPTTGGVTASFATQGDVIIAEPGALIGFAGRRVVESTIRAKLPDDFQTAEFMLEHGLIDAIVERGEMRRTVADLIRLHTDAPEETVPPNIAITSALEAVGAFAAQSYQRAVSDTADKDQDAASHTLIARPIPSRLSLSARVTRLPEDAVDIISSAIPKPVKETLDTTVDAIATPIRSALSTPRLRDILGFPKVEKKAEFALEEAFGDEEFVKDPFSESSFSEKVAVVGFRGAASGSPIGSARAAKPVEAVKDRELDAELSAWDRVKLARRTDRPTAQAYIEGMVDGFIELHGDRAYADDAAIIAGVGWIDGRPVTVIAQEKGTTTAERVKRNFGCAHPEGYRKSLRLMRQAEKFARPVVCIVDTQGAYCGVGAEERGQGGAIAENLVAMAGLSVPIATVLIGEGGSGGALALAVADSVAMLENSVYSILSPEGFASILWKDGSRTEEAARLMKMTAADVAAMGVADSVIPEPAGGAQADPAAAVEAVADHIANVLDELSELPIDELRDRRYARYRRIGAVESMDKTAE